MKTKTQSVSALALFLSLCLGAACGGEDGHGDADHAHVDFAQAPPTTATVGEAIQVMWMIETEGDLHHTDIRVCMGHETECGLGGMDSFDASFPATMTEGMYQASVVFETAGPWTLVAYAHVGATPHMSEVIHISVE